MKSVLEATPPLLPLVVGDVPPALVRLLAQEGIPFLRDSMGSTGGPPAGRFFLYDSAASARRIAAIGQVPIDVRLCAADEAEDPFAALEDEQSKRHHWKIGGLDISQEVARVDRRAVRQRVMGRLRAAIESAGGAWMRVGAFPFPYRSAFNFRVNYDDYTATDFDDTLAAIAGHDDAVSHYVCGASFDRHPDVLSRLRGRDVGSHGYWHHTYLDATDNLRNVRRAIDVLREAGIESSGFASPGGRFNRGLHSALAVLGVTHSSEYGLAYDELPFFPSDSEVLQIPVHPINLGMFLDAACHALAGDRTAETIAADVACAHLVRVTNAKYQAAEPIFLHGHSTGRLAQYPQVLRGVLRTVDGFAAVWRTTLTDFARWWRAREQVRLRVYRDGRQLVCYVDQVPHDYRSSVEFWRGDHVAPIPLDDPVIRIVPEALAFQNRRATPLPQPVRVDPAQGLRGSVLRYFDWERVTPVEEINAAWWRGWVKRTLRRMQQWRAA